MHDHQTARYRELEETRSQGRRQRWPKGVGSPGVRRSAAAPSFNLAPERDPALRALRSRKLPRLILTGDDASFEETRNALRDLRVRIERRAPEDLPTEPSDETIAIVFAGRGPRGGWAPVLSATRERTLLPSFAVVPEGTPDRAVRRLYESGAAGVFTSPGDDARLGLHFAEVLSLRLARGPARGPDMALARTVRAHLRLLPGATLPGEIPRVEARRGHIRVWGSVDSLPAKQDVEACIAAVPGVAGIDSSGLTVVPLPVSDAEIRRAGRRLLRASPGIDERTLTFSVDRGRVVLKGTAESRRELRRFSNLVSRLQGVREVEVRVEVSPKRKEGDRRVAARLGGVIKDLFSGSEIRVTFFGGIAVLTGRVSNLRTKRAVAGFVAEEDAVERIVNHLEVIA